MGLDLLPERGLFDRPSEVVGWLSLDSLGEDVFASCFISLLFFLRDFFLVMRFLRFSEPVTGDYELF
jgi:hypothetical protein